MTVVQDWSTFLHELSEKLFVDADEYEIETLADEAPERIEAKWLGSPAATSDAIAARETALGVRLPEDYRAFLLASDGFQGLAGLPHGLCRLLPIAQVGWFKDKDARTGRLSSYLAQRARGDALPPDFIVDPESFARTLLVGESDGNECILLLPPRAADEAWEVWTYDPESGFVTGDSFTEFMQSALEV